MQSILRALHDVEANMPTEYTMHFEPSRLTVAGRPFAEASLVSARTSAGLYISVFSVSTTRLSTQACIDEPQAVIHAVRPILLHMARQNCQPEGAQALNAMSPSLVRLAEICVETSSKMLVILKQLRAREILGTTFHSAR